VTPIAQNHN